MDISQQKRSKSRVWIKTYGLDSNIIYDLLDDQDYVELIWRDFLKRNADALDYGDIDLHINWLKNEHDNLDWYKVYDLLEFIVSNKDSGKGPSFIDKCNRILGAENSGYRVIDRVVHRKITEAIEFD